MIKYEDQCCDCQIEPCMSFCSRKSVPVLICDDCGDEVSDLWYGNDGRQYCKYCITGYLDKVNVEESEG